MNDRAWNDPPPLLLSANKDTPRPPKLTARVAYPIQGTSTNAGQTSNLNPNKPPPRSGFISAPPTKTRSSPDGVSGSKRPTSAPDPIQHPPPSSPDE